MATVNLGSIKFKWKGTYAGGTAYTIDDVVSYNGSSYICIQASTGNLPTNATYFEQMSSAGTNGTDGTDLTSTLTTQGDLVYRDGSGLQRLGAGTSGQLLKTQGTGANPTWVDAPVGGLVGIAHAKQPNINHINSTSYVHTGLTVNYTPVDGANNRIFVQLTGGVGQDDSDGAECFTRIIRTAPSSVTLFDDFIGMDISGGQTLHAMSYFLEDTNVTNNSQLTYQWFGRTSNSNSDFRPKYESAFTIFEIGV